MSFSQKYNESFSCTIPISSTEKLFHCYPFTFLRQIQFSRILHGLPSRMALLLLLWKSWDRKINITWIIQNHQHWCFSCIWKEGELQSKDMPNLDIMVQFLYGESDNYCCFYYHFIISKGRVKHITWMLWHNFPHLMNIFK